MNIVVDVGFVLGVGPASTPRGTATSQTRLSGSSWTNPTVRYRANGLAHSTCSETALDDLVFIAPDAGLVNSHALGLRVSIALFVHGVTYPIHVSLGEAEEPRLRRAGNLDQPLRISNGRKISILVPLPCLGTTAAWTSLLQDRGCPTPKRPRSSPCQLLQCHWLWHHAS